MATSTTILVLLREVSMRAELRGRSVVSLTRFPVAPNATLGDRIDAVTESKPLGRRTYLLSDEVFAQTIDLDVRAARGLDDAALGAALALEAQIHSGLAASEAVLAFRPLLPTKSARRFLIEEISRFDLDDAHERVEARGGRLAGVAHPAGLPYLGLAGGETRTGSRIERWHDLIATVSMAPGSQIDVDIARSERIRRGQEAQAFAGEWLLVPGAPRGEIPKGARIVDLGDDEVARRFLEAWCEVLDAKDVPILSKPKQPLSGTVRSAIGVAFACCIAIGCWFDRGRLNETRTQALAELARVRQPIDSLTLTRSEIVKLDSELREIEATRTRTPELARFDWNGSIPGRFCAALAKHRPPGVMIEGIEVGVDGGRIGGYSSRLDGIEDLLAALAAEARALAIELKVHSRRRVDSGAHAGLYAFEIDVESANNQDKSAVAR